MKEREFIGFLAENGLLLSERQIFRLERYQQLLEEKNREINLTAITEKEEVFEKHFLDSLLFSFGENMENKRCIDIGSGAGFPGLVVAICYPEVEMTLLEPIGKRCLFLNEVIRNLELDNVRVVHARSEEYCREHPEEFDLALARGVSKLNILLEIILPLLKVDGLFIALKGKIFQEEIDASSRALKTLNAEIVRVREETLPTNREVRANLFIRKKSPTPKLYPRPYAKIKKKPL